MNEKRPYRIDRWRLDDELSNASLVHEDMLCKDAALSDPRTESNVSRRKTRVNFFTAYLLNLDDLARCDKTYEVDATLPADHLLTLIQFNVVRALSAIKDLIWQSTFYSIPESSRPGELSEEVLFSRGVITHTSETLPRSLVPVRSQKSFLHSIWVDVMPFPKMRENFITWEGQFDQADFANDLVGNLVDTTTIPEFISTVQSIPCNLNLAAAADDEVTTSRNGLIVWGEPHLVDSWEATPGFLRKWAWAVQGCQDLIDSSNRWRVSRGEDPFHISVEG